MKNTINYLRTHRKTTYITQFDIASLMRLKDNSIVSRCEKGYRTPSLELILLYHLLFDIPVLTLFSNHLAVMTEQLTEEIPHLIARLEKENIGTHVEPRITFLRDALIRLQHGNRYEKQQ